MTAMADVPVDERLAAWLRSALDDDGPFALRRLSGGNSNETLALVSPSARRILRRPPLATVDPRAHDMAREHRVLAALTRTDVPSAAPLALCEDTGVPGAPFLVMEAVDGVALTTALPPGHAPAEEAVAELGTAIVDALAEAHLAPWRELGLEGLGRPDGYLERQVGRWRAQRERHRVRELPFFDELGAWLEAERPPDSPPALLHGDFHVDNCLVTRERPVRVLAVIDWEMATIGDPLLDLGLLLAFWGGDRPARPAMPRVQGFSRLAPAPSRSELADRYAGRTGRDVSRLPWFMALGLWKLAAIVEGAYAQHLAGRLDSPYARELEHDVPALLCEAAAMAGLPGA